MSNIQTGAERMPHDLSHLGFLAGQIGRLITISTTPVIAGDSSKGPKPLQLKLLTTYIPKTSAFTLAFSTSQRLRTTRASARTFFTFRHYITPSARNF